MDIEYLLIGIAVLIFAGGPILSFVRSRRARAGAKREAEKGEALFLSMFPELQPHLHPSRVVDYVVARVKRGGRAGSPWEDPAGFPMAKRAILEATPKGERTILKDASGNVLTEFLYAPGDKVPTIGMVRVGKGKFRVKHRSGKVPWASYWHPQREFDWRGPGLWTFRSTVADDSIDSSDRGTSWSDSSTASSSTSTSAAAATAAAAAGIVAAGGAFDGGGASAAWDEGGSKASATTY